MPAIRTNKYKVYAQEDMGGILGTFACSVNCEGRPNSVTQVTDRLIAQIVYANALVQDQVEAVIS